MEWIQWNGVALQLVNNQAALRNMPIRLCFCFCCLEDGRKRETRRGKRKDSLDSRRFVVRNYNLSVIALSCSILTTVTLTSRVCARSQCKAMQQVVRNLPPRRRAAAPPALSSRRHLLRLRCYCTMHAMPYFPPCP